MYSHHHDLQGVQRIQLRVSINHLLARSHCGLCGETKLMGSEIVMSPSFPQCCTINPVLFFNLMTVNVFTGIFLLPSTSTCWSQQKYWLLVSLLCVAVLGSFLETWVGVSITFDSMINGTTSREPTNKYNLTLNRHIFLILWLRCVP